MRWLTALPFLCLLALAAPAAAADPLCRLCSEGSGLTTPENPAKPVRLEVETSLDFDQVVLTGPGGGTARLGPDGSRSTSGELTGLSARAMLGEVVIRGEPGRLIEVDMPPRIDLHGWAGGSLSITRLTTDLPAMPRLDADGRLRMRFGGELYISGDAEGQYSGDVAIRVTYR